MISSKQIAVVPGAEQATAVPTGEKKGAAQVPAMIFVELISCSCLVLLLSSS